MDENRTENYYLDICQPIAALLIYASQTHDQQRCTISEVAADWCEELMIPQRIMSSPFVYDIPW